MAHAPVGTARDRGAKIADFDAKTTHFDPIFGGPWAIKKARQTRTADQFKRIWRRPAQATDQTPNPRPADRVGKFTAQRARSAGASFIDK